MVAVTDYVLPDTDWARRILFRVEVGSTAHGTGRPGLEDHDEIAVQWEPPLSVVGLRSVKETVIYRPGRGPGQPSGPGDWDLSVYTARKFAALAAQGNPSILVALFAPVISSHPLHQQLDPAWFWSDQARARFLGYARSQRERMTGERGSAGRVRRSPEGDGEVDWKYAMHMLRLGFQGVEFLTTGRITLPMPDEQREYCLAVRSGRYDLDAVIDRALAIEAELQALPVVRLEPDMASIDRWLLDVFDYARRSAGS